MENEHLSRYSEEHLIYEVSMLFGLVKIFSVTHNPESDVENIKKNALLESFGIHLRNSLDFLYYPRSNKDDVIAADFLGEGEWDRIRPSITESLRNARTRANKEFMHLTSVRISGTPEKKEWKLTDLSLEIQPALKLFVQNANPEKLSPKAALIINNCCGLVR